MRAVDLVSFSIVEPDHLTLLPLCVLSGAINAYQGTSTMLFVQLPLSDIDSAIGPVERSFALLKIVSELTHILSAILPLILTSTLHLVILPVSLESVPVGPRVDPIPANVILLKLTCIRRAVWPSESALTMFFAAFV